MHRRTLLSTVGGVVGLAGCTAADNGEPGTDDPPTDSWLSDALESTLLEPTPSFKLALRQHRH